MDDKYAIDNSDIPFGGDLDKWAEHLGITKEDAEEHLETSLALGRIPAPIKRRAEVIRRVGPPQLNEDAQAILDEADRLKARGGQ